MNVSLTRAVVPAPSTRRIDAPRVSGVPAGHGDAVAQTRQDATGGDEGAIRTETLDNGARIIIAERPGAASTKLQIGIGAGSLQDPKGKTGLAHLLEHLAFEGSPSRTAGQQERTRAQLGGNWNAYTTEKGVVFYGVVPGGQARQGASLLTDMFQNPMFSGPQLKQERAAVKNEMVYWGGSVRDEAPNIADRLLYGDHPAVTNVIGSKKTVDAITPRDLRAWHAQHFVGRNTVALVEGDPKHLPLATIRRELGKLAAGGRVDNSDVAAPVVKGRAMQIINDPSVDTVALDLMLPVHMGSLVGAKTPTSMMVSALNDQLNTRLRRQQDLTYGVSARLASAGDDHAMLRITTNVSRAHARTALTSILETLQDAQNGFGPKTFQAIKKGALASLRAAEPDPRMTVSERADTAFTTALESEGVSVPPAETPASKGADRAAIGRTNATQFAADLGRLISFDDLKLLAAGALGDGGAQLRAGIRDAGLDPDELSMNPVDLRTYHDMGLRVTKDTVPPLP